MIVTLALRRLMTGRVNGMDTDVTAILILKDLIRDTQIEIMSEQPTDVKGLSDIYEESRSIWEQISTKFMSGKALNKWAFNMIIRDKEPSLYHVLVANGMKDIPPDEDPQAIPDSKKRHKS